MGGGVSMGKSGSMEVIQGRSDDWADQEEICVCGCGKPTGNKKGTPIGQRLFYVEGAGDLRGECFKRIYG